jgi:hypothetical protein
LLSDLALARLAIKIRRLFLANARSRDVAFVGATNVRVCSLLVVVGVSEFRRCFPRDERSRLFASRRDRWHLIYIGDMAFDRVRRDQIFFAGLGFNLVAIELGQGAIFLNCTSRAWVTGLRVEFCDLINGEGISVIRPTVVTVRGSSSLMVWMIPRRASTSRRLSPHDEVQHGRVVAAGCNEDKTVPDSVLESQGCPEVKNNADRVENSAGKEQPLNERR